MYIYTYVCTVIYDIRVWKRGIVICTKGKAVYLSCLRGHLDSTAAYTYVLMYLEYTHAGFHLGSLFVGGGNLDICICIWMCTHMQC